MKKICLLLILTASVAVSNAQTKTNFKKVAPLPSNETPKNTVLTPSGYEAAIVQGNLSLIKTLVAGSGGKEFTPVYSVTKPNDASFNNGKPLQISLNSGSLDQVFNRPQLAAKYSQVKKYVTDNNISLTEEKGWVAVVKYFNGM